MFAADRADTAVTAEPRTKLSREELKIWNSSDFKKRFLESYIADSEVEPRVTQTERDQMQKILDLISTNNLDGAANMLKNLRDKDSSAVLDFTLANVYFQQEKLDEAAEAYQTAVEKYPKFRRAWRNLGLIYIRQGQFEKALIPITRVIELGGGDGVTYGLLGFAYSSSGNNLSAESAYRMAVMLDPVTVDWKMGLARTLFKQERYGEAAALCGQLIIDKPESADLWLLQANAYIGLNQPLKAAENYEFVNRLGQATSDSLNMLGDIYTNEGLYEQAVNSYICAMEKNPDGSINRALSAAKVLAARGAVKEARQLNEHLEAARGDKLGTEERKDLLKLRARLAVAEGAGDEEARVLEEIVALDPLDGEALILLGQHANRGGDAEKAVFYYERAESIEKYEADAKVRHAQVLVGKGKYDEALPLLRRAQQVKPREDVQKYLEQVERIAKAR